MASRLGNVIDPSFLRPRISASEVDEESLVKLSTLYIHALVKFESTITEANSEYEPESSSWAAMREREREREREKERERKREREREIESLRPPLYSLSGAGSMLRYSSSSLQSRILQRLFARFVFAHLWLMTPCFLPGAVVNPSRLRPCVFF